MSHFTLACSALYSRQSFQPDYFLEVHFVVVVRFEHSKVANDLHSKVGEVGNFKKVGILAVGVQDLLTLVTAVKIQ